MRGIKMRHKSESAKRSRQKKAAQLGMPHGTAIGRLKKSIIFNFANRLGLGNCFRCGKPIESTTVFSIDHKESWQAAADPIKSFFDLDNIAFAHLTCNIQASSKPTQKYPNARERERAREKRRYASRRAYNREYNKNWARRQRELKKTIVV